MIHEAQNQMKCILLSKQLRDISLALIRDQICRVYQTVNDISSYFSETKISKT